MEIRNLETTSIPVDYQIYYGYEGSYRWLGLLRITRGHVITSVATDPQHPINHQESANSLKLFE